MKWNFVFNLLCGNRRQFATQQKMPNSINIGKKSADEIKNKKQKISEIAKANISPDVKMGLVLCVWLGVCVFCIWPSMKQPVDGLKLYLG